MLRTFAPWFIAACVAFANPAYSAVVPDAPHSTANGFSCIACHASHPVLGGTGYNNICLNCHRPGFPKGGGKPFTEADMANPFGTYTATRNGAVYQTSHMWRGPENVPAAGAQAPLNSELNKATIAGSLSCVRCHNQHSNTNGKFLRIANDQDQLCLDCHRSRNTADHKLGTHPVGIDYAARTAGNPKFKGFSASSGLKLVGGKILCSSCHGVHYSDSRAGTTKTPAAYNNLSTGDGNLLRTTLRGAQPNDPNLCTTCHIGKFSHNKRGQNVQCGDCHGGHVDLGDGTTPNVRLVNRQMRFSSTLRSAKNKPVFFQSTTVRNYKDANGNGVCQSCHDIPLGAGFQSFHGAANTAGCTDCHAHDNPLGTYSVDPTKACNACHGYPPRANTAGGPDGYAAGSPFTTEAASGHATHAFTPYQKACSECHNGNSHATGTYQDVFLVTAGSVAATGGLTPSYTAGTYTCVNVYCHSDGAPRSGATAGTPTAKAIPPWNNGNGVITGQANASRCNYCHSVPIATNSHTKHIDAAGYAIACAVCHSATVTGATFAATTISNQSNHANGIKNVAFGAPATGGSWTAGTAACTNVYCHSTVQGAGGSGAPTFSSPHWGLDNGTIGCGSCHANMATDATGTGSHKTHAQAPYSYSCGVCHSGYTNATVVTATHVNNTIDLSFTAPASNGGTTPSYYGGNTKAPGSGYQQCQNVYCHSTIQNGTNGTATGITYKNPVWGDPTTVVGPCGGCHVNMATDTNGTGSHAKHARIYAIACSTCHFGAGKDPNNPSGLASPLHANGTIEIAFNGAITTGTVYSQGSNAPGGGYGTCSTSYCHSDSRGTTQTATWGATLGCGGCHLDMSTSGSATGKHIKHSQTVGYSCAICHGSGYAATTAPTGSGSSHVNQLVNISFTAPAATGAYSGGAAVTPNSAYGTCSNVYCHSDVQGAGGTGAVTYKPAISWTTATAALNCAGCHKDMDLDATATGSHAMHTQTSLNATCDVCHGTGFGNSAVTYPTHANGQINLAFTGTRAPGTTFSKGAAFNPGAAYGSCSTSKCHGRNTIAWGADTATGECDKCHSNSSFNPFTDTARSTTSAIAVVHTSHLNAVSGYTDTVACARCHGATTLNDATHMNGTADITFSGLAVAKSSPAAFAAGTHTCSNTYCHGFTEVGGTGTNPVWTDTAYLTGTPSNTGDCAKCHGFPPNTSGHSALTKPSALNVCHNCHDHVNTDGTFTVGANRTKHMNGQLDGGESAGGIDCVGCHAFAATMKTDTTTYHHLVNTPSATYTSQDYTLNNSCLQCHVDHNIFSPIYNKANPSVALGRAGNLRTTFTTFNPTINQTTGADSSDYNASGGVCLGCHRQAGGQIKSASQKSDGSTTTVIFSEASYNLTAHNYETTSTFSDNSQFRANCSKCHNASIGEASLFQTSTNKFAMHASADGRLSGALGATLTDPMEEKLCYRCHSKSTDVVGGTAKTVANNAKDWYGATAMTAASIDTFDSFYTAPTTTPVAKSYGHRVDSYSGKHRPSPTDETPTYLNANKHIECADCHNTHAAKTGNHTAGDATLAGVVTGATGVVAPTWPANWTVTASTAYYNAGNANSATAYPAATAEWKICFKCHSNANSNVTSWGGTGALAWTDLGLEFNPNNESYHPVIQALPAARQLVAGSLTGGWTSGSIMTCSDCHGTDSATSKGPHGSSVKWMLNPNTTGTKYNNWPYTTTDGNGTSTGGTGTLLTGTGSTTVPTNNFCFSCHLWAGGGAAHTQKSGDHNVACVGCHIRVPHGGKALRLLTGPAAPGRYKPNGNGGGITYMNGGSRPAAGNNMGQSNCQTSTGCSEHSASGTLLGW